MTSASDEPMAPADGECQALLPHAPYAQVPAPYLASGAKTGRYRLKPC